MRIKVKKFFLNNWALKVISFVAAVIVWIYIIIVIDPSVDYTLKDVPIEYNEELLTEQGLSIVSDIKPTVEIKLRGSRKKLYNIDSDKVIAKADLSNINKIGDYRLNVSVSIINEYVDIVSVKPDVVDVTVDKIIERRENIQVESVGSLAEGFEAGEVQLSSESVLLKGASSLVNNIAKAVVYLNYNDAKYDITSTEKIVLLDYSGNVIESSDITKDIDAVNVVCPVLERKNVDVALNSGNTLPLGYKVEISPNILTVYAKSDVISDITSVSTEYVDLSSLCGTEKHVQLIIPEGVQVRGGITSVTVKVTPDVPEEDETDSE